MKKKIFAVISLLVVVLFIFQRLSELKAFPVFCHALSTACMLVDEDCDDYIEALLKKQKPEKVEVKEDNPDMPDLGPRPNVRNPRPIVVAPPQLIKGRWLEGDENREKYHSAYDLGIKVGEFCLGAAVGLSVIICVFVFLKNDK